MDGKIALVQERSERSINAAHPLPPMDVTRRFATGLGVVTLGTLLKHDGNGDCVRWVQGTDNANLIVGVFVHHQDIDTANQRVGLVRVFGPIALQGLVAATAANGSTTAAPNAAALAQLNALKIYPL